MTPSAMCASQFSNDMRVSCQARRIRKLAISAVSEAKGLAEGAAAAETTFAAQNLRWIGCGCNLQRSTTCLPTAACCGEKLVGLYSGRSTSGLGTFPCGSEVCTFLLSQSLNATSKIIHDHSTMPLQNGTVWKQQKRQNALE